MALRVVSLRQLKLEVLLEPGRTGDSVAEGCRRAGQLLPRWPGLSLAGSLRKSSNTTTTS